MGMNTLCHRVTLILTLALPMIAWSAEDWGERQMRYVTDAENEIGMSNLEILFKKELTVFLSDTRPSISDDLDIAGSVSEKLRGIRKCTQNEVEHDVTPTEDILFLQDLEHKTFRASELDVTQTSPDQNILFIANQNGKSYYLQSDRRNRGDKPPFDLSIAACEAGSSQLQLPNCLHRPEDICRRTDLACAGHSRQDDCAASEWALIQQGQIITLVFTFLAENLQNYTNFGINNAARFNEWGGREYLLKYMLFLSSTEMEKYDIYLCDNARELISKLVGDLTCP